MQSLNVLSPFKQGLIVSVPDYSTSKKIVAICLEILQCLAAAFLVYQAFTDYNDPYRADALPLRFYFEVIGAGVLLIGAYAYHVWKLNSSRYGWVRVVPDPSLLTCFAIAGSITSATLVSRVVDRLAEEGSFSSVPDPSRVALMFQNQSPINQATIFSTTFAGVALFMGIFSAAVYWHRREETRPLIGY